MVTLRTPPFSRRVVIVGAGILGASIAWHLQRKGVDVTVVERDKPAAGTTKDSFAWINATFSKLPRHYYELNRQGVAAWRRLEREMHAPPKIQWGGSVQWYARGREAVQLRDSVERHRQWAYQTRFIDEDQLRALVPEIEPGPVAVAAYSDEEGVLDPVEATHALLEDAGVGVQYPCEVTGLVLADGRVEAVVTSNGTLPADVLVLACGLGTPRVAAMAGVNVRLIDSPGVLAHTPPQPRLLPRVALGPGSHIKQDASGRIVAGDNFAGSEGLDASVERGERLLQHAKDYLTRMEMTLERVSLGWRVMPVDEYPIVGFAAPECPNLYVVATHSGVTLAALLGEFAAAEIVDGVEVEMLAPYRPSRF